MNYFIRWKFNIFNFHRKWLTDKCVPLVREITFENAEELTEEGLPFLILFRQIGDTESERLFTSIVTNELADQKSRSFNFFIWIIFNIFSPIIFEILKALSIFWSPMESVLPIRCTIWAKMSRICRWSPSIHSVTCICSPNSNNWLNMENCANSFWICIPANCIENSIKDRIRHQQIPTRGKWKHSRRHPSSTSWNRLKTG